MPIQIHSHQLNRKTVTGILITWKSGMTTCIQKTPSTMDMLVYEFDDIEEVTFIDMIVYGDQRAQPPKIDNVARLALEVCNALDQDTAIDRLSEETLQAYQDLCDYRLGGNQ